MGNTPSSQNPNGATPGSSGISSSQNRPGVQSGLNRPPGGIVRPDQPTHLGPLQHQPTSPAGQDGISPSHLNRIAQTSSGSSSPSNNRPSSPRRRKSLELPDLNRLGLTSVHATGVRDGDSPAYPTDAGKLSKLYGTSAVPPGSTADGARGRSTMVQKPSVIPSCESGARSGANELGIPDYTLSGSATTKSVPIPMKSPRPPINGLPSSPPPGRTDASRQNPYFPHVPKISPSAGMSSAEPPSAGAGLPNYSHSPVPEPIRPPPGSSTGPPFVPGIEESDFTPGDEVIHTEDVTQPDNQANLGAPAQPGLNVGAGRQPSPARPAPAIVTGHHVELGKSAQPQTPINDTSNAHGPGVLHSSLPKGVSPDAKGAVQALGALKGAPVQVAGVPEAAGDFVPTLLTWTGGGQEVYVTGTFAEGGWRNRFKMEKSTDDFSILLNLPPGIHRLVFIVDGDWRCNHLMQTGTDGDGNLVNWIQVEKPRPKEELSAQSEWKDGEWDEKLDETPNSQQTVEWTTEIPPALINFENVEERAICDPPAELNSPQRTQFRRMQQSLLKTVPVPPALPRHLEKVILNATPKEIEATFGGAAGDDNSILPVPNHVVLNHLTATAIRNGTLAVGTTTRYKRKYISCVYYKDIENF